jgi:hypothetical protein
LSGSRLEQVKPTAVSRSRPNGERAPVAIGSFDGIGADRAIGTARIVTWSYC